MSEKNQMPNIPWEKTKPITCSKCESEIFENVTLLRSLSKFITQTKDDVEIPVNVLRCTNCKTIVEKFLEPFKNIKDE